jgi:hypothetical protein
VAGALEQFSLLVLAHLLAPLFDHTTHGWTSRLGRDGYSFERWKSTREQPKLRVQTPRTGAPQRSDRPLSHPITPRSALARRFAGDRETFLAIG